MKKLLAVDLDGTLLNGNHEISATNLDAIRSFQDRGGLVVVVTGRNLRAAQGFANQVSPTLPLVCFNGAYILDPKTEQILNNQFLGTEQVASLIKVAEKHHVHYRYYDLDTIYAPESMRSLYQKYEGGQGPQMQYFSDEGLATYYQKVGLQVPKFVLHAEDEERLNRARQEIEAQGGWAVAQSWTGLIEVMAKDVSKGSALKTVCAYLSIPMEETIAVGDQENDCTMIEAAKIGVAMGNATNGLKRVADAVTVTNDESAIAHVINTYCKEE
jgi:hypothetical protein